MGGVISSPCQQNNGGCSGACVDVYDGYYCTCIPGYELLPLDDFTCLGKSVFLSTEHPRC